MDKEEELIAKANQDLEKALKDVKPKAMEATEAALKVSIWHMTLGSWLEWSIELNIPIPKPKSNI